MEDGGEDVLPEPEMTPEERQAMKDEVIRNLRGVQELISHYQQQQQQLQEEVAEFIMRDVGEENKLHAIGSKVDDNQMGNLRNPAYLRWASDNQKGEFAVAREGNADGTAASPEDDSVWYDYVEDSFLPHGIVLLDMYSSVAPFLAGWRKANSSIFEQLERLADDLISSSLTPSKKSGPRCDCLVVVNGDVVIPQSVIDTPPVTVAAWAGKRSCVAEMYLRWKDQVLGHSAKVFVSSERVAHVLSNSQQVRVGVCGSNDVLCTIPLSAVSGALILRIFSSQSVIKAIEVISHDVDIASVIFPSSAGKSTDAHIIDAARFFLQQNPRLENFSEKTTAFVIAVKPSEADQLYSFTVLDGRVLHPELPFRWFLSWSEVCGLSQMDASMPAVRRCRTSVANFALHENNEDLLSKRHFSILNEAITAVSTPAAAPSNSVAPAVVAPRGTLQRLIADSPIVACVAVASVAVFLTAFLSRRK